MTYEDAAAEVAPHIALIVDEQLAKARSTWRSEGWPEVAVVHALSVYRERLAVWREAAIAQAARALSHPDAPSAALQ